MARASLREIARQNNLDDHTVKACIIKAGLVHGRGGYDLDDAIAACREHADLLRASGHDAARMDGGGDTAREALARVKRETVELQNEKLRLENEVRRGNLVPAADVNATVIELVGRTRTALLSIGFKIAPKLGLDEAGAKLINEEIRTALTELSDPSRIIEELLS